MLNRLRQLRKSLYLQSQAAGLERRSVQRGPVVVSGFMSDTRGIGRAARLTADWLERRGHCVIRHDLAPILEGSRPERVDVAGGVWILHVNPPDVYVTLRLCPQLAEAPMWRVGAWVWETSRAPEAWREPAAVVHEIWTPSRHSAAALAPVARRPVSVVPHPLQASSPAPPSVSGAPVGFLALADARSSLTRKNPAGAIEAWKRAFRSPDAGRLLTVKLTVDDAADRRALEASAEGRADIRFLTERLSDGEMDVLLASSDVLVSLHRAEGFGLPIAEAALAGRPSVCTAWSGPCDFLDENCAALVPFELVRVRDPHGVYGPDVGDWAEPRLDAAAAWMRRLAEDAALRLDLGSRARRRVSAYLSEAAEAPFSAGFARAAARG